ncbi:MAG TPA: phage shock protein PspA [Candidatus Hydrogenedentes bacterium]|nr:phage shock protein PspA [Candidatus Hydrogenedentota bacterium]
MGVFTRVRDIISSNINAMLDRAEDPEKLVRLMIREMEDTLVEIKASCAQSIAGKKRVQRQADEMRARAHAWAAKAELAVKKGREDLAREALMEKRRFNERADVLEEEAAQFDGLVESHQQDITALEAKLGMARDKQRILVQRHNRAQGKRRAQESIRRVDTSDALLRFEQFENRIERMEAEADLVNYGRKPSLLEAFADLETDEDIEQELEALKAAGSKSESAEQA